MQLMQLQIYVSNFVRITGHSPKVSTFRSFSGVSVEIIKCWERDRAFINYDSTTGEVEK